MGTAAFQRSAQIAIDGRSYRLLRKVTARDWQLEDAKTGRIEERSDLDLRSLYAQGKLVFESDHREARPSGAIGKAVQEVAPDLMEDAKVRRAYALAIMEVPTTRQSIEREIQHVWKKLGKPAQPPHWSSVYRWRSKLEKAGRDIHAVVAQVARRGNRRPRYPQEVIAIVESAIDTDYLVREKKTVQDALDKAIVLVDRENALRPAGLQLPLPSRKLVTSLIAKIPAFDRAVVREGRTVALRRFRGVLGHRTTEAPLARCEIDHTLMDLMVIDDETGLPLGRPVLTACIDDYSRCILGINLGFEPASFLSVARCLKHAFRPKPDLKEQYPGVVGSWDAHGVMRELVVDNGAEFHSGSLEEACYSLGIEIHYAPRKTPWFKGKIERYLGTQNASIAHTAPGTTFSNIFEKEDYDPTKHAIVRLSTLQLILRMWIVDVYHQRPHRTLKMPPSVMWSSSIAPEDILVPEDPARLDAILGRREERSLTHKGIELDGLFYNSVELTHLRMQLGDRLRVEVCVDDGDIGQIVVFSPDRKNMFVAPALAHDYARGLTAWQHRVCKRFAAETMKAFDSTGWLEAKARIAELIDAEFALKKVKSHRRIARYRASGAGAPAEAVTPETTKIAQSDAWSAPPSPARSPASQPPPAPAPSTEARKPTPTPARRFIPLLRERREDGESP